MQQYSVCKFIKKKSMWTNSSRNTALLRRKLSVFKNENGLDVYSNDKMKKEKDGNRQNEQMNQIGKLFVQWMKMKTAKG